MKQPMILPSLDWAQKLLNVMRQSSEGSNKLTKAPKEAVDEVVQEYQKVFVDTFEEVKEGISSPEELAKFFEEQAKIWFKHSRDDFSRVNSFAPRPHGWTKEEDIAAHIFVILYRYLASRRLHTFYARLGKMDPPSRTIDHSISGYWRDVALDNVIQNPPLDWAGKWKVIESLTESEGKIEALRSWEMSTEAGEIGYEWPEPPEEWYIVLRNFSSSSNPFEYLETINHDDLLPLLSFIEGELGRQHWKVLAGGEPEKILSGNIRPISRSRIAIADDFDLDLLDHLERLKIIAFYERAKRTVEDNIWNRIDRLYSQVLGLKVEKRSNHLLLSQVALTKTCASYEMNLKEYADRPEVVKLKIERWITEYRTRKENATTASLEAAIEDQPTSSKKEDSNSRKVKLAEERAEVANVQFLVLSSFLGGETSAKNEFTRRDYKVEVLKLFLATEDGTDGSIALFNEIANKVLKKNKHGKWVPRSPKAIGGLRSKFTNNIQKWITKDLLELLKKEIIQEKLPINQTYLTLVEARQVRGS